MVGNTTGRMNTCVKRLARSNSGRADDSVAGTTFSTPTTQRQPLRLRLVCWLVLQCLFQNLGMLGKISCSFCIVIHSLVQRYLGPVPHDTSYYAKCMLGGILACGVTHAGITPLDVAKCNMQVLFFSLTFLHRQTEMTSR